jgi:hypothetical protein
MTYVPLVIFVVILLGLTVAMIYSFIGEMKEQRTKEIDAVVKLRQYREKAALLDEYMTTTMSRAVLNHKYSILKHKNSERL